MGAWHIWSKEKKKWLSTLKGFDSYKKQLWYVLTHFVLPRLHTTSPAIKQCSHRSAKLTAAHPPISPTFSQKSSYAWTISLFEPKGSTSNSISIQKRFYSELCFRWTLIPSLLTLFALQASPHWCKKFKSTRWAEGILRKEVEDCWKACKQIEQGSLVG